MCVCHKVHTSRSLFNIPMCAIVHTPCSMFKYTLCVCVPQADRRGPLYDFMQIADTTQRGPAPSLQSHAPGRVSDFSEEFHDFMGKCLVKRVDARWSVQVALG